MDTQSVWEVLAHIPVGTLVSWGIVIIAIIGALVAGATKLFGVFTKYKDYKEKNEKQEELLQEHDKVLAEINDSLKHIKTSLEEQKEVNFKQIRYSISHTCDEAIAANCISAGKLRSLEEMYEEYQDVFHGNGYIKTLMIKVRKLPVVGQLDE